MKFILFALIHLPLLTRCTIQEKQEDNQNKTLEKSETLFFEDFGEKATSRWKVSSAKRTISTPHGEEVFFFDGKWSFEDLLHEHLDVPNNALVAKSSSKYHAISTVFNKPISFVDKDLVLQYQVRHGSGLMCGGSYIKLLEHIDTPIDTEKFDDLTPFVIMFGPDRCGSNSVIHFIFRHKNPISGVYEEKSLRLPPTSDVAKFSTLYTLHVMPTNDFSIYVNMEKVYMGNLLDDFNPPVNPPKEIPDPTHTKPADWVDEAQIPDPSAKKPDDWDDRPMIPDRSAKKPDDWDENAPLKIPDPSAKKPDEWDEEEDGEWEAPTINNPYCQTISGCGIWKAPIIPNTNYKGNWEAPIIDNPKYIGPWTQRKIPNDAWFEDLHPHNFLPISGIGIEIWTQQPNICFDNILLTDSLHGAFEIASQTWIPRFTFEIKLDTKLRNEKREFAISKLPFFSRITLRAIDSIVPYIARGSEIYQDVMFDPYTGFMLHSIEIILFIIFLATLIILIIKLSTRFYFWVKSAIARKPQPPTSDNTHKKSQGTGTVTVENTASDNASPKNDDDNIDPDETTPLLSKSKLD